MRNRILTIVLSLLSVIGYSQSPNGITPSSGGSGPTISSFLDPASAQVDTLKLTMSNGTVFSVNDPKYMVRSNAHPVNPAIAVCWMDTLGADTLYVNNNGLWERMQPPVVDGAQMYYALNAALTSFYPNNTPPIGALIENPFLGNLQRKYNSGIFNVNAPNGRHVREQERYFQFTNLNTWNLNTHASAQLAVQPGIDLVLSDPLNLASQQRGGEYTVVLVNGSGSPQNVTFSSKYRERSGALPITAFSLHEDSEITLSFTIDVFDTETVMRLNSAVTPETGLTNLTFTGSGPVTLNSSTGTDVTFTAGSNVTLTRTGNDLTIASTGGGGGGATDLTWTGSGPTYTLNSSTGTDVTLTQGANVTFTRVGNDISVAAAAPTPTVTGITDTNNGLDPYLSGTLLGVNYDFDELPQDVTYNGTEMIIYKDLIDDTYKRATLSLLGQGYVDMSNPQVGIAGEKGFTTAIHYGAASLPTGSAWGTTVATTVFHKAGTTLYSDANYATTSGLLFHNYTDGSGNQTASIVAVGSDSGAGLYGQLDILARPAGLGQNTVRAARFIGSGGGGLLVGSGNTGVAGGQLQVQGSGGGSIGFEGGFNTWQTGTINSVSSTFFVAENGAVRAHIDSGANGWVSGSDRRLKDNIETLSVLPYINSLRGVKYTMKDSGHPAIGVIAQEVEEHFAETCSVPSDPSKMHGVNYNGIAAISLQGVKELYEYVLKLEERVSELEKK